ncbi:HpcH/HpaI aldolase family protein [Yoonia sp. MH D7]
MAEKSMASSFREFVVEARPVCGMFQCTTSFQISEILSHTSLDYICLEAEHGATSLPHMHAQVAAIANRKPVLVRIASGDVAIIKPVLDLGVTGIMIPDVRTEYEAREIVAQTRFAPEGKRGIGGSVRASRYGMDKSYFADGPPEPVVVVAQIESQDGLDNIAAIAAVDGIDAVFIGPMDLSAQLGQRAKPDTPDVRQAIEAALAKAKVAGAATGIFCPPDKVSHWRGHGASFFLVGSDIGALVGNVTAMMTTAHKE